MASDKTKDKSQELNELEQAVNMNILLYFKEYI